MQINRRGPGEASLVEEGRELLDLVAAEASEAEFDALVERLAALLAAGPGLPRVALSYQGGLLGPVLAELPLRLMVLEEDPQDEPPLRLLQREVAADPAALAALIGQAERRIAALPPPALPGGAP